MVMTPREISSLHDLLHADAAGNSGIALPVIELLEGVNSKDPILLSAVRDILQCEARPANELRNIFRNSARGYNDNSSRTIDRTRSWLTTYLVSVPLISRLELSDPTCRFDVAQGAYIANEFVQHATIKNPTDDEVNAAMIAAYIIGQHRAGLVQPPFIGESSMKESIEYISLNLSEVEMLIPELKKRCAFDKETIEILLSTNASSLMSGEL